ncbi:MAG: phytanoyl-CoA dioxygenase family protein [Planctomycetota bacterium]
MDINQALIDLGVSDATLTSQERQALDSDGYVVLEGVIDSAWLEGLRGTFEALYEREGASAGSEVHQEAGTRRLSDLVNKDELFDRVYTHPRVLAAVAHVLQRPFKLSSLNAREAQAGTGLQALHADWGDAQKHGDAFHVVNSLWLLDDYLPDNGSTRVVPGTHRLGAPADHLDDPKAAHPDQVVLTAPAGTVVVINSHLWHGGTTNTSGKPRRVCHSYYTAREHPQQLDQAAYIRKRVYDRLSPAARWVLDV